MGGAFNDCPQTKLEVSVRIKKLGDLRRGLDKSRTFRDEGWSDSGERSSPLQSVLQYRGGKALKPWRMTPWSDVCNGVGDLTWPLGRSRRLVYLFQAKKAQWSDLGDERGWGRDLRGHTEDKSSLV